jgi:hypothetical protein
MPLADGGEVRGLNVEQEIACESDPSVGLLLVVAGQAQGAPEIGSGAW